MRTPDPAPRAVRLLAALALALAVPACSDAPTEPTDAGTDGHANADANGNGSADGSGHPNGDHAGDATWYNTGLGACGVTSDDSQKIAALAIPDFDPSTPDGNPNHNTLCGKTVTVCNDASKDSTCVDVTVEDRCVGCKEGDIDLSPTAFQALAPLDAGRIHVTWHFD
jgi:expansin (peptidoglycan-binding protein)